VDAIVSAGQAGAFGFWDALGYERELGQARFVRELARGR
jgi:hypothetical protein